jgi:peptide-methionine (S)-S-oxide reductase
MIQTITLASGCFWCTEAVFNEIQGVLKVTSGYTGGTIDNPTYEQVSLGNSGHAEAVQVEFDDTVLSLKEVYTIFFATHNPTTLNRQGNDVGTQYRSAIFYNSEDQKKIAEETIQNLEAEKTFEDPIVTEITKLEKFYSAEDYHQRYFERNPNNSYCSFVISPKVAKLRKEFQDKLRK